MLGLRNRKARFNRPNPTEDGNAIDWARWSYSPITGCRHYCPYCYIWICLHRAAVSPGQAGRAAQPVTTNDERSARSLNLRRRNGRPVWSLGSGRVDRGHPGDLSPLPRVDFHVLHEIPAEVFGVRLPANCWLGTTSTSKIGCDSAENAFAQLRERDPKRVLWAGLEPMLEPIKFIGSTVQPDRDRRRVSDKAQPRWYPPLRWIDDIGGSAEPPDVAYMRNRISAERVTGGGTLRVHRRPPRSSTIISARSRELSDQWLATFTDECRQSVAAIRRIDRKRSISISRPGRQKWMDQRKHPPPSTPDQELDARGVSEEDWCAGLGKGHSISQVRRAFNWRGQGRYSAM